MALLTTTLQVLVYTGPMYYRVIIQSPGKPSVKHVMHATAHWPVTPKFTLYDKSFGSAQSILCSNAQKLHTKFQAKMSSWSI